MKPTHVGLVCCWTFVTLEALQAVYLGATFQSVDSFLVGAWVFGISVVGCTLLTAILRSEELLASLRSWKIIVMLNGLAALTWSTYFLAVQIIEPAVVFTVFSGMVPLGTVVGAWLGLPEASGTRRRTTILGNTLIFLSILYLGAITLAGLSGFVRGGAMAALLGVILAGLSGGCTAFVILYSVRLNHQGVGPLAQFGLRFVLYTFLASVGYIMGLDDKGGSTPIKDLTIIVLIGLAVIAFPLYLVQKAVPLLSASTIAAMTSLGPAMVFLIQLFEGRVDYSGATLIGLMIYGTGALLAVLGERTGAAPSIMAPNRKQAQGPE